MPEAPIGPLPHPSPLTAGFWAAAAGHRLVVQRCQDCDTYRHYPQYLCPLCHSDRWAWAPLSGRGHVYSFTVTYQAFHPAWSGLVPYVVATIETDEGVRMVTDMAYDPEDPPVIGRPVEVVFDDAGAVTLPRFRLR